MGGGHTLQVSKATNGPTHLQVEMSQLPQACMMQQVGPWTRDQRFGRDAAITFKDLKARDLDNLQRPHGQFNAGVQCEHTNDRH